MTAGKNWLHFIGMKYYPTPRHFIEEAIELGVSRRISISMLKQMSFGDVIYCIMRDSKTKKRATIFGYFVVEHMLGNYPEQMIDELEQKGNIKDTIDIAKGSVCKKGCGAFMLGSRYVVNASIQELVKLIEKYNVSDLMIGGTFINMKSIKTEIPFQMGFRRINMDTLHAEIQEQRANRKKQICVRGHHYSSKNKDDRLDIQYVKPSVIKVRNYAKKTDEQIKKEQEKTPAPDLFA